MKIKSYKIVFLGTSGVAKTSLIQRFLNNKFDENEGSTLGANYTGLYIQTNLGTIKIDLWDSSGQDKYKELSKMFIRDSQCAILCYDITNKNTFEEIKYFHYENAKQILGDNSLIYLVANKIDLIKDIKLDREAKKFAEEKNIKYFKISAKTGKGIDSLFEDIANSLINKFKFKIDNSNTILIQKLTEDGTKIKKLNMIQIFDNNYIINLRKYYKY